MPRLYSSSDLVADAAWNLGQLAGADVDHDAQTHTIITALQHAVTSMVQVIDRQSGVYIGSEVPVHLRADAQAAADELHQAGTALEAAATWLAGAGRIAERVDTATGEPAQTWVNVVSLDGDQAARALRLLDREGPEAATVFLSQWDEGTATDNEAIIQRMTQDRLPVTPGDQALSYDAYTIIANRTSGRIAMYRLHDDEPNLEVIIAQERFTPTPTATSETETAAKALGSAPPQTRREPAPHAQPPASGSSWFDRPTTGGAYHGWGRSL